MTDLPEGTDHVRVLHKSITMQVESNEVPDGIETKQTTHTRGKRVSAEFTEGDKIPADLAADCWSAFQDRLAAYGEDGNRLDTPSRNEQTGFNTALFHH